MNQLPISNIPTTCAPDPVLNAHPAVLALPEVLRQHLWRAVHALRQADITVRLVKPQAYALCLYLTRPDMFEDDWGKVLLYYNAKLEWTKSVHQGVDCGLKKDALACLQQCR